MKVTFLGKEYKHNYSSISADDIAKHTFECENSNLKFVITYDIRVLYQEVMLLDIDFDKKQFKDMQEFCAYVQETINYNKQKIFQKIIDKYKHNIQIRNQFSKIVSTMEEEFNKELIFL
jgi:hypothetical protein